MKKNTITKAEFIQAFRAHTARCMDENLPQDAQARLFDRAFLEEVGAAQLARVGKPELPWDDIGIKLIITE